MDMKHRSSSHEPTAEVESWQHGRMYKQGWIVQTVRRVFYILLLSNQSIISERE
jgi:hypothetical protein